MVEVCTVRTLALEACGWFESARRATGDTATGPREDGDSYTRVRDGAPDWVSELVYSAHGNFLPDDWRYASIASACEFIGECDDPVEGWSEWADGNVDVYTGARLAWLSSNLQRPAYCDEGVSELGGEGLDLVERVGLGQYQESSEVYGLVLRALEERLEAVELEDEDAES